MTQTVRDVVAEITLAEHDNDIVAIAMVMIRKDGALRRTSAWTQSMQVPALLGGLQLMGHDIAVAIAPHESRS